MQQFQTKSEILLHLALGRITFLSFQEKKKLAKNLDSSLSLALLSIEDISKILDRKFNANVIWNGLENNHMAEVALYYCERMHIQIILHSDYRYPELLRQIADPPYLLFCRGNAEALTKRSVSVVGTRQLSPIGKQAALEFAYVACLDGCTIVSGLANGADGYAHQGALNSYFDSAENNKDLSELGCTIAVLPSAIDDITPYNHSHMAEQIVKCGGCLISEYEPGLGMAKWHYVARNRIIAGMSPATVVIEAPAGSGALITADFALENGRDVFFHEAAFSQAAKFISGKVKQKLEIEYAKGFVRKYKIENSPEKYLEAGAPVIKNYKDYCTALCEMPGTRMVPMQSELFT